MLIVLICWMHVKIFWNRNSDKSTLKDAKNLLVCLYALTIILSFVSLY